MRRFRCEKCDGSFYAVSAPYPRICRECVEDTPEESPPVKRGRKPKSEAE